MKRVALGMSGGVDSSVAAKILIDQGYEVIAVFMRNWDSTVNNEMIGIDIEEDDICPQEKDYLDAKKVCEQLNINLHRFDFVDEYWNDVFIYFLDELKKGRTPNPDLLCNKYVKFDAFKKACESFDVDLYAFGHYAITTFDKNGVHLIQGADKNKDQTYFLSQVSKEQLSDVIFPIGHLEKSEVRKIAKDNNLFTSDKSDSTGICFIGERNFPIFLQNYFKPKEGNVIDITTGKKLGTHYGLVNYTIGQRRGLNVGGAKSALYVCAKNIPENILYVCDEDNRSQLISVKCSVNTLNWINKPKTSKFSCFAKFRYRQTPHIVEVEVLENEIIVKYPQGVESVTPGQACVLYVNDECLGGGLINNVFNKNDEKMVYLGGK
ncbi:MAG: tRNA 2-thiouridine(34) synthase MnmA [Bacilli bacterium]